MQYHLKRVWIGLLRPSKAKEREKNKGLNLDESCRWKKKLFRKNSNGPKKRIRTTRKGRKEKWTQAFLCHNSMCLFQPKEVVRWTKQRKKATERKAKNVRVADLHDQIFVDPRLWITTEVGHGTQGEKGDMTKFREIVCSFSLIFVTKKLAVFGWLRKITAQEKTFESFFCEQIQKDASCNCILAEFEEKNKINLLLLFCLVWDKLFCDKRKLTSFVFFQGLKEKQKKCPF